MITVKTDSIELQRFNNGKRTVVYGNVNGFGKEGFMPNRYWKYNKTYNVHLGAINTNDNGVRIIMAVNGKKIFDWTDYDDEALLAPGYFSVINRDGTTTLSEGNAQLAVSEENESIHFNDMNGHWGKEYVDYLSKKGVVEGDENNNFNPESSISRAEFSKMIMKAIGIGESAAEKLFDDVDLSDWYAEAVTTAAKNGLICSELIENNKYLPNKAINRQEIASMIVNAYKLLADQTPDSADIEEYEDGNAVSAWANTYIKSAMGLGIINGDDMNRINPISNATRSEAAVMVYRLMKIFEAE